jgi:hypothetical protein
MLFVCFAQPRLGRDECVLRLASSRALGLCFDSTEHPLAESAHQFLGIDRPDAANHPGAEVLLDAVERSRLRGFKNFALYCCPWVQSLIHSPDAVTHSPAEIAAACPTTVTSSRWPRALIRKTQKRFSSLWYVTRSTRPPAIRGPMVPTGVSCGSSHHGSGERSCAAPAIA